MEAPEADFRWIARERDGKSAMEAEEIEKERAKVARGSGTGMRLIELDGRREGPIDHGECKDLLKVSCLSFSFSSRGGRWSIGCCLPYFVNLCLPCLPPSRAREHS